MYICEKCEQTKLTKNLGTHLLTLYTINCANQGDIAIQSINQNAVRVKVCWKQNPIAIGQRQYNR